MSDHEHDEDGNCIIPEDHPLFPGGLPTWHFSMWDVAGITLATASGVAAALSQGLQVMAREFNAMANWTRAEHEAEMEWHSQEVARMEMAEAYERLTGMDTLWLEVEADDRSEE